MKEIKTRAVSNSLKEISRRIFDMDTPEGVFNIQHVDVVKEIGYNVKISIEVENMDKRDVCSALSEYDTDPMICQFYDGFE